MSAYSPAFVSIAGVSGRQAASPLKHRGSFIAEPTTRLDQHGKAVTPLTALAAVLTASASRRLQRRRTARAQATDTSLVLTPGETYRTLVDKGVAFSNMSIMKILHASFMGGCYVGMAGLLSLAIAGNGAGNSVVAATVVFAALFPVNLLLVLQTGGQLFTGNTATMGMSYYEGKVTIKKAIRNLLTAYIGNILGCGLLACIAWYCGMFTGGTAELARRTVIKKCSASFGQTLVKGIMCNWLVCVGVWLSTSAQDLASKMVGIWFPISMFIMIGFEHSVANMFMLPAGIISGAPGITPLTAFLRNMLPVTIGNTIAGLFVVAGGFSFSFGSLGAGDRGSFRGLRKLWKGHNRDEGAAERKLQAA
eukprot:TRINITY_DN3132_c0_g1_i2.p1 TRINITY_DN3132_c0_g1~~TRINITY_DN3132_c0_g1_i2.p1  ORF type:complete len:383 (+),score=68.94 TRINITY_DN3132_c0_g1_i2:59-1150(+)